MAEAAAIGVGVLVLSVLFIWATISHRMSVESIVVTIVVLVLSMFTVSQGKRYQRRNLLLQKQAGESVAKTTLAAEIMMDFLREFTLKNQATISQMAESHKVRVIDELRTIIADLGRSVDAISLCGLNSRNLRRRWRVRSWKFPLGWCSRYRA